MYGPLRLNVSDLAEHARFWVDTLGGAAVSPDLIVFPNVRLSLVRRTPSGGTKGTPVNHIGFAVPDVRAAVARTRAAGYPLVTRAELPDRFETRDDVAFIEPLNTSVAFTMGPDEFKVEFFEVPSARLPYALHHIHFFSADHERMKAWYAEMFGALPGDRGPFQAVDLPGSVNLTFSPASGPVQPTRGRVLDRIGLEVDDMAGLRARLASKGIALEGSELTDPWGTTIEISGTSRS